MPNDLPPDAVNWFLAVWMLFLGGMIGSFLNVVVYRLPAGLSIVTPGSHCPRCKHPIRWRDNLPVIGWLLLRGRCRDCGLPIAKRYPLVEAMSALNFLALALAAGMFGGANLPPRTTWEAANVAVWAVRGLPLLTEIALYHAFLLSTLLCAALVEFDARCAAATPIRSGLIAKLFLPALVVGLAIPLILGEELRPVSGGWREAAALSDGLLGFCAGLALGLGAAACGWKQGVKQAAARWQMELWALAAIGLFLGWQAVCGVAVLAAAATLLATALGRFLPALRSLPPTGAIGLACLVWILFWAKLAVVG